MTNTKTIVYFSDNTRGELLGEDSMWVTVSYSDGKVADRPKSQVVKRYLVAEEYVAGATRNPGSKVAG